MDSLVDEIRDDLAGGNFSDAEKKARKWLEEMPLTVRESPEYNLATEAYTYARFFLNRQESLQRIPTDDQRARNYLALQREISQIRTDRKFDLVGNPFKEALDNYLDAKIAENYARAFAGQKSYNLDQNEIIQLSVSLIRLEKWKPAAEALEFLLRLNRRHALVNYLAAFVYSKIGRAGESHSHLREALFYKPEVVLDYPGFLPGEYFNKIWQTLLDGGAPDRNLARDFALLLELNCVYRTPLELEKKELADLEKDFQQKLAAYEQKSHPARAEASEILHYLCWLIAIYQKMGVFDKIETYRQKMIQISPESWEALSQKRQ